MKCKELARRKLLMLMVINATFAQNLLDVNTETLEPLAIRNTNEYSKNYSKEHSRIWRNYYKCQTQVYNETVTNNFSITTALAIFDGSSVKMTCDVCISPKQQDSDIEWYIVKQNDAVPLNISGKNLMLNNVLPEHQGQYFCKLNSLIRSVNFLHVLYDANEPILQVSLYKDPRPLQDTIVTTAVGNIKIYSAWGEWSSCSESHHCGKVGERVKYGPCMVIYNETYTSFVPDWVKYFPFGLPCRSFMLPKGMRDIEDLKHRPSEVLLGYCKLKCKKQSRIFKVWNSKGELVDKVDNAKGVFSSLQQIPKLPPPPARFYIFPYEGDSLTIKCLGQKLTNSPVQWHKGNEILKRRDIALKTNTRVTIDVLGHIKFTAMKMKDTNIYSCWQEGRLVSTSKVRVMAREVVFSTFHWSIFIAAIVMLCVVTVLCRIYKKQIR